MKWGRKKPSSPSYSTSSPTCSRPSSLISHVFPVSWLSKFKHKSGNSEPKPRKGNPKGKLNSPPLAVSSPRRTTTPNGQSYGFEPDDDAFWRLSFGQDSAEERKKRVGVKSVWYDHDDDEFGAPVSICPNCRRKEAQKLNGLHKCRREKERSLRSPRRSTAKERRSRGEFGNVEKGSKCRYVSPVGARNPALKTIEEEGLNLEHDEERGLEENAARFDWKILKELKMEEVRSRNEKQRKSLYVSREQQQRKRTKQINTNKMRAYSPRTASRIETCKVKALEDMKKAKLKTQKKKKKKKKKKVEEEEEEVKERRLVEESKPGLDSFAVVKCSYDPLQDFKESMVEMISEKKMSRPEELEELLACYLTLNSDQYHDMIIKVFRQVWFELLDQQQACFGSEVQNEQVFSD